MKRLGQFIIDEIVLCVAVLLALLSMLWVPPSPSYAEYMNWRVLSLLLCLMLVMDGLKKLGVFSAIAGALMKRVKSFARLVCILMSLCFFGSMLITNDVALITFVPFAIEVLVLAKKEKKMIPVIVLLTIAANLGSMLTPIGNPQNLYLYDCARFSLGEFLKIMLWPCILSLVLLLFTIAWISKGETMGDVALPKGDVWDAKRRGMTAFYTVLFLLSILVVADVLVYPVVLVITVLAVLILDRGVLKKADYSLLFTFAGFFVFVGNMGNIRIVADFLEGCMQGKEFWVALISSQVISNVPAALLLSGFTTEYKALLLGVNVGGLGTLIASMASLISYKFFAKSAPKEKGKYMLYFTGMNLLYLAILSLGYFVYGS